MEQELTKGSKGSVSSRVGQGARIFEGGFSEGCSGTAVEAHLGGGASRSGDNGT
jgi:hypothetical protein